MVKLRAELQREEALGSDNRWFCSLYFRKEITNEDVLLTYYIKSGGAADFADRFREAMSMDNRWFCSEFYQQHIADEKILWEYYKSRSKRPAFSYKMAC